MAVVGEEKEGRGVVEVQVGAASVVDMRQTEREAVESRAKGGAIQRLYRVAVDEIASG